MKKRARENRRARRLARQPRTQDQIRRALLAANRVSKERHTRTQNQICRAIEDANGATEERQADTQHQIRTAFVAADERQPTIWAHMLYN